ncbi:MAG: protoheme IX farnesyltransferase [Rhodospirillales bacterium]|nr:protoheme IX farnesyltransferase [Rhodospirillales bacterium]
MTTDTGITATAPSLSATPSDFFALLKPRVMSLVVFTGAVGLMVAPGSLHPVLAIVAVFCIAVGAGASGCINMWYERDVDSIMRRTRHRPIPAGRVEPESALQFGVVLAAASVMVMGLAINWVAAALLATAIAFYVFVYTIWLKRRTPQNIVIGGAAGAFPPMIGWAAVTGDVSLASLSLFAIIFFWTPPHFWSLALYRSGDYQAAGIPMLPVVAGAETTRRQILIYSLLMLPLSMMPSLLGAAGFVYALGAGFLSLVFIGGAVRIVRHRTDEAARWMFKYSILYLALLFALLMVDQAVAGLL